MQPFAVFDIDGTVIRWQLYHAIVDELGKHGYLAPGQHDKIRDARHTWKSRSHSNSFNEYEGTLIDTYHQALTNLKVADYTHAVDKVFETYKDQVYTYTRDLVRELKDQGYLLYVISGSQQEIIQKLGDYYGFDEVIGTRYEQVDGHFTGRRQGVYGHKAEILQELIERHGLSKKGSLAVGDTASDIAMLELVEQPIAFNPSRELFDHATKEGWKIVLERKNVIYHLEPRDGHYRLA
jgi:HAD superfamily hydrolase (TIGR01490 family)